MPSSKQKNLKLKERFEGGDSRTEAWSQRLAREAAVVAFVSYQPKEQQDLGFADVQTEVVVAAGSSPEIAV